MRSFSLLQEAIIPYIPTLITQLTQKLLAVSKVTEPVLKVQLLFNLNASNCLSLRTPWQSVGQGDLCDFFPTSS